MESGWRNRREGATTQRITSQQQLPLFATPLYSSSEIACTFFSYLVRGGKIIKWSGVSGRKNYVPQWRSCRKCCCIRSSTRSVLDSRNEYCTIPASSTLLVHGLTVPGQEEQRRLFLGLQKTAGSYSAASRAPSTYRRGDNWILQQVGLLLNISSRLLVGLPSLVL
jgi:hypothetical protein